MNVLLKFHVHRLYFQFLITSSQTKTRGDTLRCIVELVRTMCGLFSVLLEDMMHVGVPRLVLGLSLSAVEDVHSIGGCHDKYGDGYGDTMTCDRGGLS